MKARSSRQGLPPPERGRSAREARRVGVDSYSRFDRTGIKTARARHLRRTSTDVETRLWQKLRNGQIERARFRRQHPVGPYVLDFYCAEVRLVIELDGGQHNEARQTVRDVARDAWLARRGATVLRFWNSDIIENLSGVLEIVTARVSDLRAAGLTPHPALARRSPPFRGR